MIASFPIAPRLSLGRAFASLLSATLLTALPARAQSAAPEPTVETVQLSPFEVRAGSDKGYTSGASTTGTRLATDIKDLPFTVNVVTSEFLKDFSAFNLQEQMAFVPGFGMKEGQGNYTLRGVAQGGAGMLRNGFFRGGMIDTVTIDRIEVIKGPAAATYGRTSPGGIINFITKKPRDRWEASFTQTFGGYELSRSDLSVTGPIVPGKLSFRVDSAYWDSGSVINDAGVRQKVLFGAVKYQLQPGTSLTLEFEQVRRKDLIGEFHNVWYSADGTAANITRIADELRTFDNQVPDAYTERAVKTTNLTFEHRLSPTLSMRVAGFVSSRDLTVFQVVSSDIYNAATGTIGGRQPTLRTNPSRDDSIQADLTKTFDLGPTQHKLLVTYDHVWSKNGDDKVVQLPGSLLNNTAYNIPTLSVANPNYYVDKNFADYTNVTRNRGTKIKIDGMFLSDRLTAFDGKLVIMAGGRYDKIDNLFYNLLSNPQQHSQADTDQWTHQGGVTYTPVPEVSFFVNNATSFVNQTFNNLPELTSGTIIPPEQGKSTELGVKTSFLKNKLNVEAAVYDQKRTDIARSVSTAVNADGVDFFGVEKSKGLELATNYSPSKDLFLFATASWIRSQQDQIPLDTGLVGFPVTNVPPRQWSYGGRYEISTGVLKSVFFTLGVFNNGPQLFDTSAGTRRYIKQPGYSKVDLGTGYTFADTGRFSHRIRFSVKNAFDKAYYTGSKKTADGRQFIVRYVLDFK